MMWHATLPQGGAISGRTGNALYDEARRQHIPPSALRNIHGNDQPQAPRELAMPEFGSGEYTAQWDDDGGPPMLPRTVA